MWSASAITLDVTNGRTVKLKRLKKSEHHHLLLTVIYYYKLYCNMCLMFSLITVLCRRISEGDNYTGTEVYDLPVLHDLQIPCTVLVYHYHSADFISGVFLVGPSTYIYSIFNHRSFHDRILYQVALRENA